MSIEHDYGSYCEWLAGEGVGSGELRDYDQNEEQDFQDPEQQPENTNL